MEGRQLIVFLTPLKNLPKKGKTTENTGKNEDSSAE